MIAQSSRMADLSRINCVSNSLDVFDDEADDSPNPNYLKQCPKIFF